MSYSLASARVGCIHRRAMVLIAFAESSGDVRSFAWVMPSYSNNALRPRAQASSSPIEAAAQTGDGHNSSAYEPNELNS